MGICKNNNVKKKVTHFCYELRATLLESSSVSTQTETEYEDIGCQTNNYPEGAEEILEEIWELSDFVVHFNSGRYSLNLLSVNLLLMS